MLLKELKSKSGDNNLFDFIDYFNEISDTKPYYTEFILKYGNKQLIQAIAELNDVDGLGAIGSIFILKSEDWKDKESLNDKIKQLSFDDRKVTTTNEDTGNIKKDRINSENRNNTENVVPYDSDSELKTNTRNDVNSYNDNETLEDIRTGKKETVYTGYDRNRLYYLERFKNQPEYRYIIYDEIVDMLCLQIY